MTDSEQTHEIGAILAKSLRGVSILGASKSTQAVYRQQLLASVGNAETHQ